MEEILYVVDEEDKLVRKATRKEVKKNALTHRTSRVIILDKEGKFLVQKRSLKKDMYPGYWDIGIAGTVIENESYESTASRELMEELGISGISNTQLIHSFLFKIKFRSSENKVNCKVYKINYNGKLKLQKEEIDEIKFLALEDVKNLIKNVKFHPAGSLAFNKYLKIKK